MKLLNCPNFNLIVWKKEAGRIVFSRIRCKMWSCDYCAEINRQAWRSHLKKRIGGLGGTWYFVTITAAEWYREKAKSLANLRRGLNMMFKRIKRIWGKIEYVRVYEIHEKGAYHAHAIIMGLSPFVAVKENRSGVNGFTPADDRSVRTWAVRTWFKKTARACKMGYMVDVQRVSGVQKVVNYVVKYITKETQDYHIKNVRRIQASAGIGSPSPRDTGKGWNVGKHVWASEAENLPLYDTNLKLNINPSYWLNNIVYPPQ